MEFQDKGRPLSREGLDRVCSTLGAAEPEIWAVLTVETRGFGFLPDRRPRILFERHVFFRLVANERYAADNPDICNKTPGGYSGGAAEYARLDKAIRLDRDAALKSASWGIGQIMGFNHEAAGFPTAEVMVTALLKDEDAQLLAMADYIKRSYLDGPLRGHDWGFVRARLQRPCIPAERL